MPAINHMSYQINTLNLINTHTLLFKIIIFMFFHFVIIVMATKDVWTNG